MTMPINLDGEKPDNVSQEQWDRLKNVFDDIYADESEEQIMPDKKLTDSEIVKALECCLRDDESYGADGCENCPLNQDNDCTNAVRKCSFDLINLQKAEKEELVGNIDRLKAVFKGFDDKNEVILYPNLLTAIDCLLIGMVGDSNARVLL